MNRTALPPAAPFDPASDAIPQELDALFARRQSWPLVVLIVGPGAERDGWGARTAIAVADLWASRGRGIVLADLGFDRPALHEALGVANGEGVADLFLFGASLQRVVQPVPRHPFRLAPAGLFVDDAAAVLAHRGWDRIAAEMNSADTTLLAYTPADAPGLDALLGRAGHAIALALPGDETAIAAAVPQEATVFAWLAPPPSEDVELRSESRAGRRAEPRRTVEPEPPRRPGAPPRTPSAPEPPRPRKLASEIPSTPEERIRFIRARAAERTRAVEPKLPSPTGAARVAPPPREAPVVAPIPRDRWLEEPPPIQRRRQKRVRGGAIAAAVLIVSGIAAGAWFGWRFLEQRRTVAVAQAAPAPAPAAVDPEPVVARRPIDEAAPYSVAVEAHQDLATALGRARALSRASPALAFFVGATPVDDVVYYRVLAGPAPDSAAAAELLAQLYSEGHKTALDRWAIRRTTWAFNLGNFENPQAARDRAAELERQGIPVYILEIPYTSGPSEFRLYAGAFEGQAEAQYMRELLAEAGLRPRLIRRTGRPAA